jgi:hypothetical protein
VHILFLALHAHAVPLDPAPCTYSSLYPKGADLIFPQGVFICVAGLGMLVASDELTNKNWDPIARGKGDGFMIAGATLYGFS